MRTLVIGSGLIGLTTAYFLRRTGHEVLVLEREAGPGQQASFANGSLLTPSMPEPWNAPGCWRVLLSSIGRSDAALQLRLRVLPTLARWGVAFLRNSRPVQFERNTLSNLRLSLHSLEIMQKLREDVDLQYGHRTPGTLRVFRETAALDRATAAAQRLSAEGLSFSRLSRQQAVELEPALAPIADQLSGALHYFGDETGDAHRFCVALAEDARRQGIDFRFGAEVSALSVRANRVEAVIAGKESFTADRYVVAGGSYSTELLRRIGVMLPVRPAKGYSVTIEADRNRQTLRVPIVDDDWHAAIVPLGSAIRVAGTAEFAGYDRSIDAGRVDNLLQLLRKVLPQVRFDSSTATPWSGLRAMSADGVPIIGATPIANLFVNTGHGHLGWTMAAGSGQLLASLMNGTTPAVDPARYSFSRFA